MKKLRKLSIAGLLAVTLFILTGCNTTEGIGKDLERAGEEIQDAVNN